MTSTDPSRPGSTDDNDDSRPPRGEDQEMAEQEIARRRAEADLDAPVVQALKETSREPVEPVRYTDQDTLCFDCHKGVSCWNACCYDTDITLTPYDLLRLAGHFEARPADVVRLFTVPGVHDKSGMPVAKLKMLDQPAGARRPCVFLDEAEGCTVYENRPAACRYYPLGLAAIKISEEETPANFYFLVKESHCRGHEEAVARPVSDFRASQGVAPYDEKNSGWMHILMKLTSWRSLGGPWGKEPEERVKRMFHMATTDMDAFRRFVFNSSFFDKYDIAPERREQLAVDDEALLELGLDWLRNVIFNEPTIALREDVLKDAIAKAQRELGAG